MKPKGSKAAKKTPDNWIYGQHAVLSALTHKNRAVFEVHHAGKLAPEVKQCLHGVPNVEVDKRQLDQKFPQTVHQGIAARVAAVSLHALEDIQHHNVLLALDQVTDPQNLGAILRSADAFGCGGVLLPKGHHAPLNAIVAKAACGALETVSIAEVNLAQALDKLKSAGFWCIGLAGAATTSLHNVKKPEKMCIVMGSEGEGLRPLVAKQCDELVKIEMQGTVESLNVSVAAGITLHALTSST